MCLRLVAFLFLFMVCAPVWSFSHIKASTANLFHVRCLSKDGFISLGVPNMAQVSHLKPPSGSRPGAQVQIDLDNWSDFQLLDICDCSLCLSNSFWVNLLERSWSLLSSVDLLLATQLGAQIVTFSSVKKKEATVNVYNYKPSSSLEQPVFLVSMNGALKGNILLDCNT